MKDLFLLRPEMVFLNHGSFGACPAPVFAVYQDWQRALEAQPVEFLGRQGTALLATARAALAAYLGAEADDLVFVPNATTGVNTVARSLRLAPGDEVLATNLEYGAVDRTWQFLCAQAGATYVRQPIPLPVETAAGVVEALWQGVTPRTRVICVSHITSITALILPVAEICRRARQAGILTVIDGAHAPGQIPLDLAAIDADFYTGNCHKWLCAPKGAAFLHARRAAHALVDPLVVSWGWQPDESASFVDRLEWQGTRDIAAYLSVPAAIEFQAAHDWPRVRAACHALLREIRHDVEQLTGLPPICPDSPDWYAQMASLPLPPCDPVTLQRRLWEETRIEVPIVEGPTGPLCRVSIQAYNTPADGAALLAALAALLPGVAG
jgi:isopenicillin-N epimerase